MAARSSVALLESGTAFHHHRASSHCRAPCTSCSPLASRVTLKPCQSRSVVARAEDKDADVVVDDLIVQASVALGKAREALADVQRAEEFLATTAAPSFIPSTLTFGSPLSEQSEKSGSDAPGGGSAPARSSAPTAVRPIPVRGEPLRTTRVASAASSAASRATSSGAAVQTAPPPPATAAQGEQLWVDSDEAHESHEAPTMILQRQRVRNRRNNNQTEFAEPNSVQELSFPLQARALLPCQESPTSTVLIFLRTMLRNTWSLGALVFDTCPLLLCPRTAHCFFLSVTLRTDVSSAVSVEIRTKNIDFPYRTYC